MGSRSPTGDWLQREIGSRCKSASPPPRKEVIAPGEGDSELHYSKRHLGPGFRLDDTIGYVAPCLSPKDTAPSRPAKQAGEFSAGPSVATVTVARRNDQMLRYERSRSQPPPHP